jgi:hypothetical protein
MKKEDLLLMGLVVAGGIFLLASPSAAKPQPQPQPQPQPPSPHEEHISDQVSPQPAPEDDWPSVTVQDPFAGLSVGTIVWFVPYGAQGTVQSSPDAFKVKITRQIAANYYEGVVHCQLAEQYCEHFNFPSSRIQALAADQVNF